MNAYELADELERVGCTTYCRCEETIPMLRQQADRIASLESQLKVNQECNSVTNAEPVAWATEDLEEIMTPELRQAHIDHPKSCTHKFFPIPLYTTPQTKHEVSPLSDEEIMQIVEKPEFWTDDGVLRSCIDLCRAIEERILGK